MHQLLDAVDDEKGNYNIATLMLQQMTAQSAEEDEWILSFSWFIWDMIIKSMTMKVFEQNSLSGENTAIVMY